MHRDTVIGIVGVAILVAAMVGVFSFERTQAASLGAASGLALGDATLAAVDGTVGVGATESVLVNVSQMNVTKVLVTVTWTSPAQAADLVNVSVTPPTDPSGVVLEGAMAEAATGTVTVEVLVPNGQPTSAPLTLGTGEWKIEIRDVSRTTAGQGVTVPQVNDGPLSFSVATTVTSWQPAATA